jgi:hypothetical protein
MRDDAGSYRDVATSISCHAQSLNVGRQRRRCGCRRSSGKRSGAGWGLGSACANHLQSRLLRPLNRHAASQQRLSPLEAWASRALSAEEMFLPLNCSRSPAFRHGYLPGAGTHHTIVAEPAEKRVLIAVRGDAAALDEDMMDLNLDQWLHGNDLPLMRLESQLGGMSRPFEWPIRRDRKAVHFHPRKLRR